MTQRRQICCTLLALLAGLATAAFGCTSGDACLRHSDCDHGLVCREGTCAQAATDASVGDAGDAALDAALTLAHVALSQRDEAGILCYDEGVTRWLPPRGGRGQLNRMIAAVHDVQPRAMSKKVKGFIQSRNWFQSLSPVYMEK